MKKLLPLALLAALSSLAPSAMACYVLYNSVNEVVYDKFEAPVNMRMELHETVPARVPGGHLVFSTSTTDCSGSDQIGGHYAGVRPLAVAPAAPKAASKKKRRARYNP